MAVWEKQQNSNGCSTLQNYRYLCALLTYLSDGSVQGLLVNNIAKKTQEIASTETVVFSHELLLN